MSQKKVLCVEDNINNMLLISRVVEAEGHELIRAEDSTEALDALSVGIPDIILLDVNLPGMNGLDLAQVIRNELHYTDVPIIAITANVLVGDKEKTLAAGCDDYLPKPLDIRKLRSLMRDYMGEQ